MGSSTPSAPTPQAPAITAKQQQDLNTMSAEQTQAINQVNQTTPTGSLTYTPQLDANGQPMLGPGGVPLMQATTKLNPAQQALLDTQTGTQQIAGNQAKNLLTGANYGATDPTTAIGGLTSGLVQNEVNYLKPFFDPQTNQLKTQLLNQGLTPNTPAYDQAMNNLRQSQGQVEAGFIPQAQSLAVQQYQLPLTMAQAEMGIATPSSVNPTTTPQATVTPANLVGATADYNNAIQQAYNSQVQANSGMMSGLFGIPTAILGGLARNPAMLAGV